MLSPALPVRQHLDAARAFWRAQFPGLFVPNPRLLGIGTDAAHEALGQDGGIVSRTHGKRGCGIARIGSTAEKQACGREIAGFEENAATLDKTRNFLRTQRELRGWSAGRTARRHRTGRCRIWW